MKKQNKDNVRMFIYIAVLVWVAFGMSDFLARAGGKNIDPYISLVSSTIILFMILVVLRWKS